MSSILVAGVAVLDFVFHMKEFPACPEKYRADSALISGGGNAANSAVAIARLGGLPHLAARIGDDEIADLIISGLAKEDVPTDLLKRFANHRSSFSSIYIDAAGERQIMNFRDTAISMKAHWLAASIPDGIGATLGDTRWPDGARVAMQAARDRGIAGIIDAESPVNEAKEALDLASHVAFSAQGATEFTGEQDFEKSARIADTMIPGTAIVTNGDEGVITVKNGQVHHFPAFAITPVDTLGAGDVWHGAFALALAEGQSEEDAITFASASAAIKCSRKGGRDGAPTRQEVTQFIQENA